MWDDIGGADAVVDHIMPLRGFREDIIENERVGHLN
jgi:hypothetical protein